MSPSIFNPDARGKPRGHRPLLLAVILTLAAGCGTPQMGDDERCMAAADALWTAINSRQAELLEKCAAEIEHLSEAGAMPQPAAEALEGIVAAARSGDWPAARDALRTFIRRQRRSAASPS